MTPSLAWVIRLRTGAELLFRSADEPDRAGLARGVGVPVSTLRHWEGDRGLPVLLRLAAALGVPVERLAEGVEDPAGEEEEPAPEKPRWSRERSSSPAAAAGEPWSREKT